MSWEYSGWPGNYDGLVTRWSHEACIIHGCVGHPERDKGSL